MIRGAYKTSSGCQDMHLQLSVKARDSSCLSLAYREMKPPGWDAPAFYSNVYHASLFNGLRHGSQCKASLARVIYEWTAGVGGNVSETGSPIVERIKTICCLDSSPVLGTSILNRSKPRGTSSSLQNQIQ